MPIGIRRLLLILILSLWFPGCSQVKFAYNQLDWLIPYYTKDYLDLDHSQRDYLDQALNDLLYWHCGVHLHAYAKLLREANAAFQDLSMDEGKLRQLLARIESYWKEIKRQASPAIAELFATSSREQIDALLTRLREKNEQWQEDYKAMGEEDLRRKSAKGITDELERWFGPLHERQQEVVASWSRQLPARGTLRLVARQHWQAELQALLQKRHDPMQFTKGVERLFVNPEKLYSADYRKWLTAYKQLTLEMVAKVGLLLDETQRKHLDKRIRSVADDLDELACQGEPKPPVRVSKPDGFLQDYR